MEIDTMKMHNINYLYEIKRFGAECLSWQHRDKGGIIIIQHLLNEIERASCKGDPFWISIDGMTKSELDAYDYGVTQAIAAVTRILDGKDTGQGTANQPWESLRRKLIELVKANNKTK